MRSIQFAHGAMNAPNSVGEVYGNKYLPITEDDKANGRIRVLFYGQTYHGKDRFLKPSSFFYDTTVRGAPAFVGIITNVQNMTKYPPGQRDRFILTIRPCTPSTHVAYDVTPPAVRRCAFPIHNIIFVMRILRMPFSAFVNPTVLTQGIGELRFRVSIPDRGL